MTRWRAFAASVVALVGAVAAAPSPAVSAPPGDDEVIAFEVRGYGNGHGRGLSQWGAFGRAMAGQGWQTILNSYYGGTESGSLAGDPSITVKLNAMDGVSTVGVMSTASGARWRAGSGSWSTSAGSIYVEPAGNGTYDVYTAPERTCTTSVPDGPLQVGDQGDAVRRMQSFLLSDGFAPGPVDGVFGPMTKAAVQAFQVDASIAPADGVWTIEEATEARARIAAGGGPTWTKVTGSGSLAGPIEFSSASSPTTPDTALGLCRPDGSVVHYRGVLRALATVAGARTVNAVSVEDYLRGVVPQEVPASWGGQGGGAGMNALRAQAVAARSYGVSQQRGYWLDAARTTRYATTCDSSSCQVYGGAAKRTFPGSTVVSVVEHVNTDQAIADTAGVVRRWPDSGGVVSTEFSASNGPRTAGGAFPPVDDAAFDGHPGNPLHAWTRVIDADSVASRYGLSSANGVVTAPDADSPYEGVWANEVRLGNGSTVSAWDFRNAFGLSSPGFVLVPILRTVTDAATVRVIGDSVGVGVAGSSTSPLRIVTEGMFDLGVDVLQSRRTQGGSVGDGVTAATSVPVGTEIVVVELGYNDDPAAMAGRVDAMMAALRDRDVGLVLWVNLSTRRPSSGYEVTNAALASAADRWDELVVLDWNEASSAPAADRWFSDGVHLTTTGQAQFSIWLRQRILDIVVDGYTPPRTLVPGVPLRVPVVGVAGVPDVGVAGVALNVTAVGPVADGWLRVWPCGSPEPVTSSVNYVAGGIAPNAVVVPVDASGEVCVGTMVETDVVVDVSSWFDSGVRSAVGRLVDTRDVDRVVPGVPLRVPVVGVAGVPDVGVAGVALNVTAVGPVADGWLRVWPCGSPEPVTSSVNYVAGGIAPNAVVVPVDASGEVCVGTMVETDVVVDVSSWFDSGLRSTPGGRIVDTRYGTGPIPGR